MQLRATARSSLRNLASVLRSLPRSKGFFRLVRRLYESGVLRCKPCECLGSMSIEVFVRESDVMFVLSSERGLVVMGIIEYGARSVKVRAKFMRSRRLSENVAAGLLATLLGTFRELLAVSATFYSMLVDWCEN